MNGRLSGFALLLAVAAVILPAAPAWADAIDGDWCYRDGRHMTIQGPHIVTPSGTAAEGDYQRHFFTYTIPEKDPGAGSVVHMTQLSEEMIHVQTGADLAAARAAAVEVWHRCQQRISAVERFPARPQG